jgi:hypothetical protein
MQRIAENYYLSLPLAVILVFLPLLNWIGLSWAVFATLRQNTYLGVLSIAIVGFACFYAINGLQFHATTAEWLGFLAFVGPLWGMAYSLRVFRSLRLSLQLGFFLLALIALLHYGVFGAIAYDEIYKYLLHRLFAGEIAGQGVTHTLQELYLQTMARAAIIAWPMMLFLLQVSLLMLARYLQSRWYYPGGFQTEFHALRLSRFMTAPLVFSFLWAILMPQTQVAMQLAGLSALLYSIAGIALVHWYIQERQLGMMWVVLLYAILFILSAWVLPLLAVIALLDSHLDLRTRLKR